MILSSAPRVTASLPADGLNDALGAIRVLGVELIEEELKPHLNTVLTSIKAKSQCHSFDLRLLV